MTLLSLKAGAFKARRVKLRMSQAALAAALGVTSGTIFRMEKTDSIKLSTLGKLEALERTSNPLAQAAGRPRAIYAFDRSPPGNDLIFSPSPLVCAPGNGSRVLSSPPTEEGAEWFARRLLDKTSARGNRGATWSGPRKMVDGRMTPAYWFKFRRAEDGGAELLGVTDDIMAIDADLRAPTADDMANAPECLKPEDTPRAIDYQEPEWASAEAIDKLPD